MALKRVYIFLVVAILAVSTCCGARTIKQDELTLAGEDELANSSDAVAHDAITAAAAAAATAEEPTTAAATSNNVTLVTQPANGSDGTVATSVMGPAANTTITTSIDARAVSAIAEAASDRDDAPPGQDGAEVLQLQSDPNKALEALTTSAAPQNSSKALGNGQAPAPVAVDSSEAQQRSGDKHGEGADGAANETTAEQDAPASQRFKHGRTHTIVASIFGGGLVVAIVGTLAWLLCKRAFGRWKYGTHSARSDGPFAAASGRARGPVAMGRGAHALDGARAI